MRGRRVCWLALGLAIWLNSSRAACEDVISTIAGGGPSNLLAVAANLDAPSGVAIDAVGNLFIAARAQSRVFKIDELGQLTVVAGDGFAGFSGDGGLATSAHLSIPSEIALDAAGNLFIADRGNNRIRRVDAISQIISTVAGNGTSGFSGDGGLATNSSLGSPAGVAVDPAGNLFIADQGNSRIRRVDADTGIITTVAGSAAFGFSGDGGPATSASLSGPTGIAVDSAGSLFIADRGNHRIRLVDATTQTITTVAGIGCVFRCFSGDGGLATSASLREPTGVELDAAGNLFIADERNQRIRRVDAITQIITTVAGNSGSGFSGDGGLATTTSLWFPSGVALDVEGNLFIADRGNDRIRRVDAITQIITTVAGNGTGGFSGDGGLATNGSLSIPRATALDAEGNLFIADHGNLRIRRVDGVGQIVTTVAGNGTEGFSGDGGPATSASLIPAGVAVDAAGNFFIADLGNRRIRRVDAITRIITTVAGDGTREFSGDGGVATSASLGSPEGVALDAAGNLFIADTWNFRVRRVDGVTQIITTVAGDGCVEFPGPDSRPRTGCFGGDGDLATRASLWDPTGIALDAAGNLLIADSGNHRIRRVDAITQIITTVAGNGTSGVGGDGDLATNASLSYPTGVALDEAGNLYIADQGNSRIRRVNADTGIITTVAGSGTSGFGGDGGPATSASLAGPTGVALNAAGNLVIADWGNQRIRQVGDAIVTVQVEIDIKPDSNPNSINPTDQGVIPVALLGSESFDVSEINGATLRFARGEAAPVHDLADPTIFADHLEDINGDGMTDLVSHYWTEESGIAFGDTVACLVGETLDGAHFNGCDAVRTVPDSDGDALLDRDEESARTNAAFRDSDGDGYDDGVEVLTLGTDPLDALDPAPAPVAAENGERRRQRNRRR